MIMKVRVFHPPKHGFPFANNWELSASQAEDLMCLALEKIPDVIKRLEEEQPGVSALFCVKEWLEKWVECAWPGAYRARGGMVYTALDFFYYKKKLPRGANPDSDLRSCIWQRNQEALKATAEKLLYLIATKHLINVSTIWYDQKVIEKTIKKQLKVIKEVTVEEVGLDLRWPAEENSRSGNNNRREWEKIKKQLDDQGPWPITLLDNNLDPFRQKTLIATCYQELPEQRIQVDIYDMDHPGEIQTLQVDLGKNRFDLMGRQFEGWFCEKYEAKCPPSRINIFTRLWKLLRVLWRLIQVLLKKLKIAKHGTGSI